MSEDEFGEDSDLLDEEIGLDEFDGDDADAVYDRYMDDAAEFVFEGVNSIKDDARKKFPLAFNSDERVWKVVIALIPRELIAERASLYGGVEDGKTSLHKTA
jgi:ketosteroid isomerase-like protein